MIPTVEKRIEALSRVESTVQSLTRLKHGFEKECLRVDEKGMLANTQHPRLLGASLVHPMITTDYSEALLEFITPPTYQISESLHLLEELHCFTHVVLKNEYLWSASMPCSLPSDGAIPIADYGNSNLGRLKHIYRVGLGHRYGRVMQTIAGIHYNFSFPDDFWQGYAYQIHSIELSPGTKEFSHYVSERYLGLIRNALRFGWVLPLLFGASPAIGYSFLENPSTQLHRMDENTWFLPHATSLRLGDLGYHNKKRPTVTVSYNSFEQFIHTMQQAVHTPDPMFSALGIQRSGEYQQLSDSIFQIEAEHYSLFRPKRVSNSGERMLHALNREGIEYIEIRALDINPFVPLGIESSTIYFLNTFMMLCLLLESPPITSEESERIQYNHTQVVHYGRDPMLRLKINAVEERKSTEWGGEIMSALNRIAGIFDLAYAGRSYSDSIYSLHNQITNLNELPSAKMLSEMQNKQMSHFEFVHRWSHAHQRYFKQTPLPTERFAFYKQLTDTSWEDMKKMEQSDTMPFDVFLKEFLL